MDVLVGSYIAPQGGPEIAEQLEAFCRRLDNSDNPWREHVKVKKLRPFLDGNGRVGRAIWAWHIIKVGRDPFQLGFFAQVLSRHPGERGLGATAPSPAANDIGRRLSVLA